MCTKLRGACKCSVSLHSPKVTESKPGISLSAVRTNNLYSKQGFHVVLLQAQMFWSKEKHFLSPPEHSNRQKMNYGLSNLHTSVLNTTYFGCIGAQSASTQRGEHAASSNRSRKLSVERLDTSHPQRSSYW